MGAKAMSFQIPRGWVPSTKHDFCQIQSCCLSLGPRVCSVSWSGSLSSVKRPRWSSPCLVASAEPTLFRLKDLGALGTYSQGLGLPPSLL